MLFQCQLFLVTILLYTVFHQGNAQKSTYIAAVVEIKPQTFLISPEFALYFNIEQYALLTNYLMRNASRKPDIIVFPELGLQGDNNPFPVEIPSTEDNIVLCQNDKYSMGLRSLSCLALETEVYLVVNLAESHLNVTQNKTQVFSTTIVLDRRGALVARYRKYNLNGFGFDKPGKLETSFFVTDFGVTFGLFTGDDLLFKEPAINLVNQYRIKHFVHPSKWFSELPFLTAIQAQASWAYSMNAVLLSAGYNDPDKGNSGSGIYQGREGPLEYSLSENAESFALVAEIPKELQIAKFQSALLVPAPEANMTEFLKKMELDKVVRQPSIRTEMSLERMEERMKNIHDKGKDKPPKPPVSSLKLRRDNIESFTTSLIKPTIVETRSLNETFPVTAIEGSVVVNETICKGEFCCNFQLVITTSYKLNSPDLFPEISGDNFTNYRYRLAVFNGPRMYKNDDKAKQAAVQICAIMPCLNDTLRSCGLRTDNKDSDSYLPSNAPPLTHFFNGLTYVQTGTTFEKITIITKITGNDSAVYPNILLSSINDEDYGSLPNVSSFAFSKQNEVINNIPKQSVKLQTLDSISNLGSVSIYARIFHLDDAKSSAAIAGVTLKLFIISIFVMFYN